MVFIGFDGYSGPETSAWEGINADWVPIVPAVARWQTKAGKALTHTQLTLMMAWGITVNKSQDLTLEKVVLSFEKRTFLQAYLISLCKVWHFAHFNHACLKKPKEINSMLMLNKDNEHHNQLGFQLNMYESQ